LLAQLFRVQLPSLGSSAYAGYEIIITRLYLYGILGALGKRYSLRLRNYGRQDCIIQGFVGGKTVKARKVSHKFIDPPKNNG
jgi:hypothetical protein